MPVQSLRITEQSRLCQTLPDFKVSQPLDIIALPTLLAIADAATVTACFTN